MGKIVLSGPQNVSLDGVVQDPDGKEGFRLGGWFVEFGGKDLEAWNQVALDEALRAEAWLLGRRSYEFFGVRWRPRAGELADRLNSMPKYVVSSTLEAADWNNSKVLKGDVVTEVSKLKQELDGEIVVPASYQLGRTLIEHDLVDELRLVVFPVVLGAGERLFGENSGRRQMRLVDSKRIGEGLAYLTYGLVHEAQRRRRKMTTTSSRPFIAAMQVTLDGYILGPDGEADWVDSWADGLELLPEVDAFVLGGGMFPDYEQFWAAILDDPAAASEWLGRDPYPRELAYARIAARTPHLVLSTTLSHATWPTARIVADINELHALKGQAGNPAYVVGGPTLVTSLIDSGLLDELRLIVHPVAVGRGTALFGGVTDRQALELLGAEPAASGRVVLTYRPRKQ